MANRKSQGKSTLKAQSASGDVKQQKVWADIQAKRQANRRKQRIKTIVISVIAVLVIAAVAAGIWWGSSRSNSSAAGENGQVLTGLTPSEAAAQKDVDQTEGVVIGPDGAWSASEGVPTIELYFSYACPGCLSLESQFGTQISQLALDGKINLIYHPVSTHQITWEGIASDAALKVAQNDPDHFVAFHQALMDRAYQIMFADEESLKAQGNTGDLASEEASAQIVQEVAQASGVSQEVIDTFSADGTASTKIKQWTQEWAAAAKAFSGDTIGTPMLVRNGTQKLSGSTWSDEGGLEDSLVNGE